MCYYLYGAVNKDVDSDAYERVAQSSEFHFRIGTKHDVKMCVANETDDFRVTDWICDCESPVGGGDVNDADLTEIVRLLDDLKTVHGAEYVYLCKVWVGMRNKREEAVHIDDIDLPEFLANLEAYCLYKIDMRPKES